MTGDQRRVARGVKPVLHNRHIIHVAGKEGHEGVVSDVKGVGVAADKSAASLRCDIDKLDGALKTLPVDGERQETQSN